MSNHNKRRDSFGRLIVDISMILLSLYKLIPTLKTSDIIKEEVNASKNHLISFLLLCCIASVFFLSIWFCFLVGSSIKINNPLSEHLVVRVRVKVTLKKF